MADVKSSTIDMAVQSTHQFEKYEVKGHAKLPPDSYLAQAFGRGSYDEIGKVLEKENKLRMQGVRMLQQILKKPTDVITAVKKGLLGKMVDLLDAPESLDCVLQFIRHRYSRMEMLTKTTMLESLYKVIQGGDLACRLEAYKCLEELSAHPGISKEHKEKIITLCIKLCASDKEAAAQSSALTVLQKMIMSQGMTKCSMDGGCVKVVTSLLDHKDSKVRETASETLQYVTVSSNGKDQCIESGCVPKLVANLKDDNKRVRLFSSAMLMQLANKNSGKEAIIGAKGVSVLLKKLDDEDAIKNYALQCISNAAEHPKIRAEILGKKEDMAKIEALKTNKDPIVAGSAQSALDTLLWVP